MTDYPEQPGFLETEPPLDEMMFYDGASVPNMEVPIMEVASPKHFSFPHQEVPAGGIENIVGADEGVQNHYIPHSLEHGIHFMQTQAEQQYQSPYDAYHADHMVQTFHRPTFRPPSTSQPSPSTMTEFFQLMSQPENVQAYMQFLQNQHESAAQQTQAPPASQRSRSNSQPTVSSFPMTPASRSSWTEPTTDTASSRERKIAKYRTKRARRLTASAQVQSDSCNTFTSAPSNDMPDIEQYMPALKIQKTTTRDLENRLMSSEEQVRILQSALASRDAELQFLRQVFDDQQRQLAIYAETPSNPSSSACTSPRPRSPSTPALVSSPSSVSIGSSTMDTEFGESLETSSLGSTEHMELLAAQKRREKLKKLGGPPSDVYYPWWNGISLNHPAFQQKEDWASVELRTHEDLIARERLNYLLNMQRFKMEQSRLATEAHQHPHPMGPAPDPASSPASSVPPPPLYMSHPYTHQPTSFYQSPHQSHIQTGSPVHAGGYWSGHFAPNTAEKIDFSKISLRKTSSEAPPRQEQQIPQTQQPFARSPTSPVSPQPLQHPHIPPPHRSPNMQASPTAAIWRDAMAHPEMHAFPQYLSWIQEQPEFQHRMQLHPQTHRTPDISLRLLRLRTLQELPN